MKSRISKWPAYCLKETLDSRAVVLSCPFSDLLFPTFNMHVDVTTLHNLYGEWVQAFGAMFRDRYLMVNGCLDYYRPIITNACLPTRSQTSLRRKLETIPLKVSGVVNSTTKPRGLRTKFFAVHCLYVSVFFTTFRWEFIVLT